MRDARITPIYEGTNGVQALDLLGRKVFGTGGKSQQMISARIVESIKKFGAMPEVAPLAADLGKRLEQWGRLTAELGLAAMKQPGRSRRCGDGLPAGRGLHAASAGAGSWRRASRRRSSPRDPNDDFYKAKLVTARHYFARLLPRVEAHAAAARAGAAGLMALTADQFAIA